MDILKQRFDWIRENLISRSLIFVNIRDFSETMLKHPTRVFYLVRMLASLPTHERIFGVCFEDEGKCYAEQLAVWTSCVREEMDKCGWKVICFLTINLSFALYAATVSDGRTTHLLNSTLRYYLEDALSLMWGEGGGNFRNLGSGDQFSTTFYPLPMLAVKFF